MTKKAKLTPPQKLIAQGVSPLVAYLTQATCGEACWEAREDVCRCSCGGKNHGCLRTADGIRPTRNAKIDGVRYELKAVAHNVYAEADSINKAAGPRRIDPPYTYYWQETESGAPARVKRATKEQLAKWPELASFREQIEAIKANGQYCWIDIDRVWPQLLWLRIA